MRFKKKKKKPWLEFEFVRQESLKTKDTFGVCFVLTIYSRAWGLPLRMICFPSEISLEETIVLFASDYQLEIASGLGMGHVSTSLISPRTLSGVDVCRPIHAAFIFASSYVYWSYYI